MENVRNFVDLVALGDNIAAREELDKILSQKSFDALDSRKQQIAGAIFGTTEEPELDLDNAVAELEDEEVYAEEVEYDGEQLDELSKETLKKYTNKAQDSYSAAVERKDDAENRANHIIISSRGGGGHMEYHEKRKAQLDKAQKTMKKRAKGIYRAWDRTKPGWDKD